MSMIKQRLADWDAPGEVRTGASVGAQSHSRLIAGTRIPDLFV